MNEQLINVLKRYDGFHPVVPFAPGTDKLHLFDFSANNSEITADLVKDTNAFTQYVNSTLAEHHSLYGIGGYNENRSLYSRSEVFDDVSAEPRRLHLGIDIWGKPYTHVMAPVDGIVHSFAFNNAFGDYGATIILTHQLEGFTFHTLYGHLSFNSLKNLNEGDTIKRGEVFTEFGIQFENGQWPPHLHFQLIIDMERNKGDYPGVCKYSEREKYLKNCPDPDLVLRMMRYAT
ncbi:MAG: peptidoglycan DD-metalloendopeptidase family protein [Candidatus Dadabacteria bacterium]